MPKGLSSSMYLGRNILFTLIFSFVLDMLENKCSGQYSIHWSNVLFCLFLIWKNIVNGFMFGSFVSIWDAHENESPMKNGIKTCRYLLIVPMYGPCGFTTAILGFSNQEFWSKKVDLWGQKWPLIILAKLILTCRVWLGWFFLLTK